MILISFQTSSSSLARQLVNFFRTFLLRSNLRLFLDCSLVRTEIYTMATLVFPGDFLGIPKLVQLVNSKGQPIGTRMVIRVVTEHNTGRYECTAVNQFGQDKETLDLKVS